MSCVSCGETAGRSIQPECGHIVCTGCVSVLTSMLPVLGGEGIYVCYQCGQKSSLPSEYYQAIRDNRGENVQVMERIHRIGKGERMESIDRLDGLLRREREEMPAGEM